MAVMDQKLYSEEDKKLTNEQTYDAALGSMVTKLDSFVIPLINEAFGERNTDSAQIILRNNKHIIQRTDGSLARRESDAFIELYEVSNPNSLKKYLFECEAWYDNSIVLRIAEYGSSIAIETAQMTDEGVILTHPNSAVIFLHPNRKIPERMKITHRAPNGEEMSYYVSAIQIKDYSVETIFRKRLLILLPFYLFRFANELKEMEENDARRKELSDTLTDINQRLETLKKQGTITEYQKRTTQELLLRVSERLTVGYQTIKKEVKEIMSGALARTLADEILEQGLEQGRAEGREEGLEETANLFGFLLQHGKNDEAAKATSNKQYLKELMLKYKNGELSASW